MQKMRLIQRPPESVPHRLGRLRAFSIFLLIVVPVFAWLLWVSFGAFRDLASPTYRPSGVVPGQYHLAFEAVSIPAADGAVLAGWLIPAANPAAREAVVLVAPEGTDKGSLMPIAARLHDRFHVLAMDIRASGESGGRWSTLGLAEAGDVERAAAFLRENGAERVGVFGSSVGAAAAVLAAAADPGIMAIALWAPYTDVPSLARGYYGGIAPLAALREQSLFGWGRLLLGGNLDTVSPVTAARGVTQPVFLIHSRADAFVPFEHARRFQQAFADHAFAEFYFTDRGGHGEYPTDLADRLLDFFSRALATAR